MGRHQREREDDNHGWRLVCACATLTRSCASSAVGKLLKKKKKLKARKPSVRSAGGTGRIQDKTSNLNLQQLTVDGGMRSLAWEGGRGEGAQH